MVGGGFSKGRGDVIPCLIEARRSEANSKEEGNVLWLLSCCRDAVVAQDTPKSYAMSTTSKLSKIMNEKSLRLCVCYCLTSLTPLGAWERTSLHRLCCTFTRGIICFASVHCRASSISPPLNRYIQSIFSLISAHRVHPPSVSTWMLQDQRTRSCFSVNGRSSRNLLGIRPPDRWLQPQNIIVL